MLLHDDDRGHLGESTTFWEAQKKSYQARQNVAKTTTIYLQKLWESFVRDLPFSVEQCKVHVTFTAPANWPHDAIQRMRKAIDSTEFGNPLRSSTSLICEPEAAAVFLLTYELQRINPKVRHDRQILLSIATSFKSILFPS